MNKQQIGIIVGAIIAVLLLVFAVVGLNNKDAKNGSKENEVEEVENVDGTVLNTLPVEAFEVQDNTITDTWGVVLKHDQLPEELQNGESYTITIDGKTYDLTLNKYNDNVFNGQVPSLEHAKEEVEVGVVNKK